ncbi:unnamed protein product [Urochloa humidicola]
MADGGGPEGYLLGGIACCCAGAGCYYLGKSRLEYDLSSAPAAMLPSSFPLPLPFGSSIPADPVRCFGLLFASHVQERRRGAIGAQVWRFACAGAWWWTAVLLDSSSGHLPLVTVSGRVRSDTPLIGQQSGLPAAIVEQHVTQHYLKKTQKKEAGEEYLV